MLRFGDHRTLDLFDPWGFMGEKRRRMLEGSWAGLFRKHCLLELPVALVAARLCAGQGRPTKELYAALGMLVLQQVFDLTDAQAVQELAFSNLWQYALDVREERDACLCERTLRNYRRLVIEHGLDERLFVALTDHLIKVFQVDVNHQRIDSTVLRSAMRRLGRLGIFTESIERFLRELATGHPLLHAELDADLVDRYRDGGKGMCFGLGTRPSEAGRCLKQAAEDLLLLVRRLAGTPAAALEGYALLKRILAEQCEVDEGQGTGTAGDPPARVALKDQKGVGGDSLQNPCDPDATYNAHKGVGYLMQVMETYQASAPGPDGADHAGETTAARPDLITHVSINAMTDHDQKALSPAIADTAERGIGPKQVLADTPYGVGDNPAQAARQGVELVSPAQPPRGHRQGKLSLEDFILDERGLVTRCPAGHGPISTSATEKNYQARFDRRVCEACPLRPNCPVQKARKSDPEAMRLQYDKPRLEMFRRRCAEREERFRENYRWRAGMEGTISRLKHEVGLACLRVRRWAAVKYEAFMSALGLNIRRCAACG